MSYTILQYHDFCLEENIYINHGWFEKDYEEMIHTEIGLVCDNFETKEEAYRHWFQHYSGTDFEYCYWKEVPEWECYFYVLCEKDNEDNLKILEISSGSLTEDDICHIEKI